MRDHEADATLTGQAAAFAALLAEIAGSVARVVSGEIALVRAEAERSVRQTAGAAGLLACAVILALVAMIAMAGASVLGLIAAGLPAPAAALIVGIVLLAGAWLALNRALVRLRPRNLALSTSAENIRRDLQLFTRTEKSDGHHAIQDREDASDRGAA